MIKNILEECSNKILKEAIKCCKYLELTETVENGLESLNVWLLDGNLFEMKCNNILGCRYLKEQLQKKDIIPCKVYQENKRLTQRLIEECNVRKAADSGYKIIEGQNWTDPDIAYI